MSQALLMQTPPKSSLDVNPPVSGGSIFTWPKVSERISLSVCDLNLPHQLHFTETAKVSAIRKRLINCRKQELDKDYGTDYQLKEE